MKNTTPRPRFFSRTVFVVLITAAGSSAAHQQWLAPSPHIQSGDSGWISFDHTFGDVRFRPASGPGSYYSWWFVGPDGLRRNVPHLFLGKTRTVGEFELTEPGTYRLEAVEDLMPWTRIKINGEETWQPGDRSDFAGAEIVRSRVYFNKSVSYVTLEKTSGKAVEATGDPLEIVFTDHPNNLRAGATVQIRVLASGKPLAEQKVDVFSEQSEGHDASTSCTTSANGSCDLTALPRGRYLLATSVQGDSPDNAATDGFSHSYSVVVEVRAPEADD